MIFLKLSEKNEFSKIEKCSILLFKAKYEEAEETLAFLNAEKQCNNDVVDDLNRENSSLKDQLKDLSSLSSGINNSSRMSAENVNSLKAGLSILGFSKPYLCINFYNIQDSNRKYNEGL